MRGAAECCGVRHGARAQPPAPTPRMVSHTALSTNRRQTRAPLPPPQRCIPATKNLLQIQCERTRGTGVPDSAGPGGVLAACAASRLNRVLLRERNRLCRGLQLCCKHQHLCRSVVTLEKQECIPRYHVLNPPGQSLWRRASCDARESVG